MGWSGRSGLDCPGGGRPEADRSRDRRQLGGVVRKSAVSTLSVRPPRIVVDAEVLDHHRRLGERPELLAVEALIAEAAVEALHEAVLPRTGWLDVDRLDLLSGQPGLAFVGDKLRAVVREDELGCPMLRMACLTRALTSVDFNGRQPRRCQTKCQSGPVPRPTWTRS